jgi:predicted phage tail protein
MNASDFDRRLWHFRGNFVRVHDADTVVVQTDNGMRIRHETHVRILDLWEPELWTAEGKARADALASAIVALLPPPQRDWNVRMVTEQMKTKADEVTSFSRWVGSLWLVPSSGEMVDLKAVNPQVTALLRRGLEARAA